MENAQVNQQPINRQPRPENSINRNSPNFRINHENYEVPKSEHGIYEAFVACGGSILGGLGMIPCCFCFPNPFKTVNQGNVGLFSRFGKFYRSAGPGLYYVNVLSTEFREVPVSLNCDDIPSQMVTTKDNVSVSLDSIIDPLIAVYHVNDVRHAIIERTQATLRHVIGTRTFQDAIENREAIAHEIEKLMETATEICGVHVESILIKDLQPPKELIDAFSSAATQRRLAESRVIEAQAAAQAKVIQAQSEVDAARLMREAADLLSTPAAMQMRYLQTMHNMAQESGSKVIFMPFSGDSTKSVERIVDTAAADKLF